ncbi:MAG: hypothetical protein JW751_03240, partial [Polyangiaceae bacterium]|nr:hypothetical protein [Polyangiaceae bacterium]
MRWRGATGPWLVALLLAGQACLTGCRGCEGCRRSPQRRTVSPREPRAECATPEDCLDDNPCTEKDCVAGRCELTPVAENEPCSEAFRCVAADRCDGRGHCVAGEDPVVDDGNPCTLDTCSPERGIIHSPVPVDDQDACTVDACDPGTGEITHLPVETDDRDDCTFDSCDPRTGVAHQRPNPTYPCGNCGPGYHASSRAPSADCPGSLRSHCMPDCGAAIYSCDATCPPRYRKVSQTVTRQCGASTPVMLTCVRQ